MRNKYIIPFCFIILGTCSIQTKTKTVTILKKAKQYSETLGNLVWHTSQSAVGALCSSLALSDIFRRIQSRALFREQNDLPLMIGAATAGPTCLYHGLHGLYKDLKIKKMIKLIQKEKKEAHA